MTPAQDKHVTFLHLYLLTWILLVLSSLGITFLKPGLSGGYLMSAWNSCVGLAFVMSGVADVVAAGHGERRVVDNETYEELEGEHTNERDGEHPEPDESTPLIPYTAQSSSSNRQRLGEDKGETEKLTETWWWILQFIISVPLPVILFAHVTMLFLDAMSQTLSDGAPIVTSQSIPP
jgi:membrane protease PFF1-like protein